MNLPVHPAVLMKSHLQDQIVKGVIDLINHIEIKAFNAGNPLFHQALFNQLIGNSSNKHAENVSYAEMYPHRMLLRQHRNLLRIISRQSDSGLLPLFLFLQTAV